MNAQGGGAGGCKAFIYQCGREKGESRVSWELSGSDSVLTANALKVKTSTGTGDVASEKMNFKSKLAHLEWETDP